MPHGLPRKNYIQLLEQIDEVSCWYGNLSIK